jgi:cysteine synthase
MERGSTKLLPGNTPVCKLQNSFPDSKAEIWLKLEHLNPGGSIKDRIALSMIEDAESKGVLCPGGHIIEPTSGNTGIALAMIAAKKGYECTIVMPENMSAERIRLMRFYGAETVLTPASKGMTGAIEEAGKLFNEYSGSWMPMQFDNHVNPATHEKTTALEIIKQLPEGIDVMVAGVGTGGHLSGIGKVLKKTWPGVKVYAVEPAKSAVISGNRPGKHLIQGLGAGFVPKNLDLSVVDEVIRIEDNEAVVMMKKLARAEGLGVGFSSGAVAAAIEKILPGLKKGSRILSFTYDRIDRYLSEV